MSDSGLSFDAVVVGGGVVGLSIARALCLKGYSVVLFEKARQFAQGISARNSGVIHAGIYYPQSWLKTQLCIRGRRQLYEYLDAHDLPYRKVGKLIVAKASQRSQLEQLLSQARNNGVEDLAWVDQPQLAEWEPYLEADLAIFSPQTGIVDVTSLSMQLEQDVVQMGGLALLAHEVIGIKPSSEGFVVDVSGPDGFFEVSSKLCINSSGFNAVKLLEGVVDAVDIPQMSFAQGHYYVYQAPSPFAHLIYPLPDKHQQGLGVHSTLDMHGQIQFGPDVRYIDRPCYEFDDTRREDFIRAIHQYYPDLDASKLQPGQVGVRPKLARQGEPAQDFLIQSSAEHGVDGLVNLLGIESPGLTSALAIADHVVDLVSNEII